MVHPCTCGIPANIVSPSKEIQRTSRENSECILIGKIRVLDVKKQLFKLTVIESLDGANLQDNVYLGKGWKTCEPYITHDATWLIYGYTEDGFLRPNICGISRGFDTFTDKYFKGFGNEILDNDSKSMYAEIRKDFLSTLYLELKALRHIRHKKSIHNPNSNI